MKQRCQVMLSPVDVDRLMKARGLASPRPAALAENACELDELQ